MTTHPPSFHPCHRSSNREFPFLHPPPGSGLVAPDFKFPLQEFFHVLIFSISFPSSILCRQKLSWKITGCRIDKSSVENQFIFSDNSEAGRWKISELGPRLGMLQWPTGEHLAHIFPPSRPDQDCFDKLIFVILCLQFWLIYTGNLNRKVNIFWNRVSFLTNLTFCSPKSISSIHFHAWDVHFLSMLKW